jgi:hypothetical protein
MNGWNHYPFQVMMAHQFLRKLHCLHVNMCVLFLIIVNEKQEFMGY